MSMADLDFCYDPGSVQVPERRGDRERGRREALLRVEEKTGEDWELQDTL